MDDLEGSLGKREQQDAPIIDGLFAVA